jgi:hypothetical protein
LTLLLAAAETKGNMARYSAFLGRKVEVQYRAGDILLPASGTFVADSGRSIFLEQSFEQKGQKKQFRWEIPYQYVVRLEEKPEAPDQAGTADGAAASKTESAAPKAESAASPAPAKSQRVPDEDTSGGGGSGLLPFRNRPKTA